MQIGKIIEELQEKTAGIILMKNGMFYIAVGADAIILSNEMGLKRTCFGKKCKVGFFGRVIRKIYF